MTSISGEQSYRRDVDLGISTGRAAGEPLILNHVLSSGASSGIFDAIFKYFEQFSPGNAEIVVSETPLPDADIHHYHRCHLETRLSNRAVCTVHHDLREPDYWLEVNKFLDRYREAKLVVCLNQGQKDFLRERGILHTVVIPHGYNSALLSPKRVQPRKRREDGKVTLGIVSTYYIRRCKGEAYLLELVKRLSPQEFEFVLVGSGRLKTAEMLMDLGYGTRLFETLPYRLFQNMYESMDYLLMCSQFEGGPANLPEAMATQTPVLATSVGLVPDYITDGKTGIILTGDPDNDAERIAALVDEDSPLVKALEEGAVTLRGRSLTWQECVGRYFDAYGEYLGACS